MSKKNTSNVRRKPDQTLPYADLVAEITIYCAAHYISFGFGFTRNYVKGQWEAHQDLNLALMMEVFKECPNDTFKEDDCKELLYLRDRLAAFSAECKKYGINYFWVLSYEKRVFYDLENVGDVSKKDPSIMWRIELIAPGFVQKKIRAPKEPIREVLLALNGLPRGKETVDDLGDISDFVNQLQTDEEYNSKENSDI